MERWPELDRFLRAKLLHVYVDLAAAGAPAEQRYPGAAAHLRACRSCGEEFEGLLAALRDEAP